MRNNSLFFILYLFLLILIKNDGCQALLFAAEGFSFANHTNALVDYSDCQSTGNPGTVTMQLEFPTVTRITRVYVWFAAKTSTKGHLYGSFRIVGYNDTGFSPDVNFYYALGPTRGPYYVSPAITNTNGSLISNAQNIANDITYFFANITVPTPFFVFNYSWIGIAYCPSQGVNADKWARPVLNHYGTGDYAEPFSNHIYYKTTPYTTTTQAFGRRRGFAMNFAVDGYSAPSESQSASHQSKSLATQTRSAKPQSKSVAQSKSAPQTKSAAQTKSPTQSKSAPQTKSYTPHTQSQSQSYTRLHLHHITYFFRSESFGRNDNNTVNFMLPWTITNHVKIQSDRGLWFASIGKTAHYNQSASINIAFNEMHGRTTMAVNIFVKLDHTSDGYMFLYIDDQQVMKKQMKRGVLAGTSSSFGGPVPITANYLTQFQLTNNTIHKFELRTQQFDPHNKFKRVKCEISSFGINLS